MVFRQFREIINTIVFDVAFLLRIFKTFENQKRCQFWKTEQPKK